jgi:hypothetical protein
MKRLTLLTAFALCILPVISGCGIGYNRTLFVTKTNAGFEVSAEPPTFELDISRLEGVVAPQFENGKKLPVLASFRFQTSGPFSPNVGSAFAAGDAATTLASLYGDATPSGDWTFRADLVKGSQYPADSTLILSSKPDTSKWLPSPFNKVFPEPEFQTNDVRPVFFGTDTSIGLRGPE